MTALAQNSPPYFHPGPQATRRALKILRGVHIYAGALCAMHNDRLMPYPPGGYRSATSVGRTVLQGGPLQLGIDSSQVVGVIAKVPNVTLAMAVSGGGTISGISVTYGSTIDIAFTIGSTATNILVAAGLMANAEVARLIDAGALAVVGASQAAQTKIAVPHVRLAGIADLEYDNSANTSDYTWASEQPLTVRTGIVSMANDGTDPASASDVPAMVGVFDDQTIVRTALPLQLQAQLFDWTPTRGPFIRIL
jgi:hypothetical protein